MIIFIFIAPFVTEESKCTSVYPGLVLPSIKRFTVGSFQSYFAPIVILTFKSVACVTGWITEH